jgi:hypothetical protein
MHHDNDNTLPADLLAWDSVTRIRPSPNELMALLHLRHDGPRPPTRAQLDAAGPLVIQGERWCGRDGRWRACESYEQPRGSRRAKPLPPNHARRLCGVVEFPDLRVPDTLASAGEDAFRLAVASKVRRIQDALTHARCATQGRVTRCAPGTPNCDWLGAITKPAAGHNFTYRHYGAVEDSLIALIDANRTGVLAKDSATPANDNAPAPRRRRSRRQRRAALAA